MQPLSGGNRPDHRTPRRLEALRPHLRRSSRLARSISRHLGTAQRNEAVHAVDNVDLVVGTGEVVGLVGESGCGKSTLGRMVAGIMPPTDGTVLFKGRDIAALPPRPGARRQLKVQMIFQDPFASLNPRLRVEDIVGEAPLVHGLVSRSDFDGYLDAQLRRVGLDPSYRRRYPHQFSGGQRQRIGIARALAVQPEFLVCDEAVAALDVSIQAQILNLFMDLRRGTRPHLPVHQPRSRCGRASLRPCADHVSRPHRGEAHEPKRYSPGRTIPTRRRCSPRSHASTHASDASPPSRARSPAQWRRPPAATSIRAVRMRCRGAVRRHRACARSRPAMTARAT